jgi:serine/threonine protein kinase
MMRQLEHPKILSLMEVYESDKSVYLVSEYMRGGELL